MISNELDLVEQSMPLLHIDSIIESKEIYGMNQLPPHFIIERKKEVVFHIKGGFSTRMFIPIFMKDFPEGYKASVIRCEETFYRMREKGNE